MTVRRALLAALPLLSACLSIDVIPQLERDAGSPPDGPGPDGDAEVPAPPQPPPDPGPPACKDRGTYSLGGVEYRGVTQACEGSLVCVDAECVEPPPCLPGEALTRCAFTPAEAKGVITGFVVVDDYVYWLERGTLDTRSNPNNDGTIARTKFGEWGREVVLGELDFYDGIERRWRISSLTRQGRTLNWQQTPSANQIFTHYLDRFETDRVHQRLPENGWAFAEDAAYRGNKTAIRRHPLDGAPLTAFKDAESIVNTQGANYLLTRSLGSYVYGYDSLNKKYVRFQADSPYRIETTSGIPPQSATETRFVTRLADGWLATAPRDENTTTFNWKAVAGPGTLLSADEAYLYWARTDSLSTESRRQFAARTRLDGLGEQEVLFEFGEYVAVAYKDFVYAASSQGAVWYQRPGSSTLQFAPFPKHTPSAKPDAGVEPDASAD